MRQEVVPSDVEEVSSRCLCLELFSKCIGKAMTSGYELVKLVMKIMEDSAYVAVTEGPSGRSEVEPSSVTLAKYIFWHPKKANWKLLDMARAPCLWIQCWNIVPINPLLA